MAKLILALTLASMTGTCMNNFAFVKPGREADAVKLQQDLEMQRD